jgi:Cu(I)/Ag(I) efflux system membrane fusion protein/cobalt-zinc-cadmium efflux system membrane fusion protein
VSPTAARVSARIAAVLGLVLGVLLTALILIDPLQLSGLDERLRELAGDGSAETSESLWTCPMHPTVIEAESGACPMCGMDLVTMERDEDSNAEHGHGSPTELWTCPMHPTIVESEAGSCPICGMDLVATEAELGDSGSSAPTRSNGRAAIRIDPAVVQNMNVTTELVQRRDISRRIRTVGSLDYDEDRMVTITTKYAGYVEAVSVDYIGQPVAKGDPLFEVYSPELVQTQQELLSAVRYAERLSSADPETTARAESLVTAAKQRLAFWDVSSEQVQRLVEGGEIVRTLTVVSPASGVVMKRMHGLEGMRIQPGMDVIHIAGLDTLRLQVEVYEDQLPWIREGSVATVTLTYLPGETFTGRVRYVEPEVSETTRTVQLTVEVPNPKRRLRVGMYTTVIFEPVEVPNAVTVPSQAVLRTGVRDLVVIALGDGRFAPREVTLGREGEGYVQVLQGIEEGETIVTSAQFLIDSESNLREAVRRMAAAKLDGSATTDGHRH